MCTYITRNVIHDIVIPLIQWVPLFQYTKSSHSTCIIQTLNQLHDQLIYVVQHRQKRAMWYIHLLLADLLGSTPSIRMQLIQFTPQAK